ncbi:hypothetical protein RRF57_005992 [Xylaria bambusicola]|uniref:Uncharacterized protein n=1 Tax=Xylaria bambusicola TaxID=326684 RepID=A0AAN7Z6G4_9PEZI
MAGPGLNPKTVSLPCTSSGCATPKGGRADLLEKFGQSFAADFLTALPVQLSTGKEDRTPRQRPFLECPAAFAEARIVDICLKIVDELTHRDRHAIDFLDLYCVSPRPRVEKAVFESGARH